MQEYSYDYKNQEPKQFSGPYTTGILMTTISLTTYYVVNSIYAPYCNILLWHFDITNLLQWSTNTLLPVLVFRSLHIMYSLCCYNVALYIDCLLYCYTI